MTDKEIVKTLECCVKHRCSECPAKAMFCSESVPMAFAIDLINSQKAEIERLDGYNANLRSANADICGRLEDSMKEAKAEAVKEFAERLKPMYKILCVAEGDWCYELDRIVKEMVGEDNA